MRTLGELGFDSRYLPECLDFIRKAGERAPELASAGGRLIELETKSGKSYDRFLLEFNEQLKAQAGLSEKVKSLEGRELELYHSIRHLEKLKALQETIDRNKITPSILESLIRDGLRLQALGFTTQHAEVLAKELAQRGLDAATASAQVSRLLREYSDLEQAKEKAETEANRWQLALDMIRNDTASLQAQCEGLKGQLRNLEEAHRERKELLEKQYRALESTLRTEHAAREQELEAGHLTRKREIETEVQDLQNKASGLKTEIALLESARANVSETEAALQKIEESIAKSRTLATIVSLVENPTSLKALGKSVEAMLVVLQGFNKCMEATVFTSWRNRLNLKQAVECLSNALAEEVTR